MQIKLSKIIATTAIATSLLLGQSLVQAATLNVYTYSSFSADWGVGPKVKTGFEAICGCELKFTSLDDGVSVLNRIRLEGAKSEADVVIGLDTNMTEAAVATGLFAEHSVDVSGIPVPNGWTHSQFVPFDYGYFSFVYNSEVVKNPPKSMQELIDAPDSLKIVIQDPRTSTPGLGLMLWMKDIYGDKAAGQWAKLAPKIVTVTKGWSEAYYTIFQGGEADMVLSYTTSPAYHITVEKDEKYKGADFAEGHYMQIEVAAKLKAAPQPELADMFLNYIASDEFQSFIPQGQWMYRLGANTDGVPASYDSLVKPAKTLLIDPVEVEANRKAWISEWQNALK